MAGLRERKRTEKRARILGAARELFSEHGFEQTSMQQIATRAKVGFGTIFLYAENKRDLLFCLFNDNIRDVVEAPFEHVDFDADADEILARLFYPVFDLFASDVPLARDYLRESTFVETGEQGGRYMFSRDLFVSRLAKLLETLKAQKRIDPSLDTQVASETILAIFAGAVRRWLRRDRPTARGGKQYLRSMVALAVNGMK